MSQDRGDDAGDATAENLQTAFASIGNETRAEVIRVLGENPYTEVPFSELRARVDEDIDSGQFNYHLKQLLGQFVTRTDDGYALRPEGVTLYRMVRAGTFTREVSVDSFAAGFDCHFCGTGVEAEYETGILEMACPGCDFQYGKARLPPSAIDPADPEASLPLVDQYLRHEVLALSRGVCPFCVNELDVTFVPAEDVWLESADRLDVFVDYSCDHCGNRHFLSVGVSLLYHPSLVAFFDRRGVDVTTVPHWEFEFAVTDNCLTVHGTDPWEVTLAVTCDGDTLELTVDDDLTVLREDRA